MWNDDYWATNYWNDDYWGFQEVAPIDGPVTVTFTAKSGAVGFSSKSGGVSLSSRSGSVTITGE